MRTPLKLLIVAALAVAVVAAIALKTGKLSADPTDTAPAATATAVLPDTPDTTPLAHAKLPKLLDLGAGKCIPCKMMAPILEELKLEYAGRMNVEFIDVWENRDAGNQYGVEVIPTQIFYDSDGKELFRHTGFLGKEDSLNKWKELGMNIRSDKPSE